MRTDPSPIDLSVGTYTGSGLKTFIHTGEYMPSTVSNDQLSTDLIAGFDQLFGLHPGFRPAHAKGIICSGTFSPSAAAAKLTRAPHANHPTTPVILRFSDSTGIPVIPDNDANASPRGLAIRFNLGAHVHTDIVSHSTDGFPTQSGEEFLEFLHAIAASGPDVAHPSPIEKFLGSHPAAAAFVMAAKPFPISLANESFFAVSAVHFTNAAGETQFGRMKIYPLAGNQYLSDEEAAKKSPNYLMDEMGERLGKGPVRFKIVVQLANAGDVVDDATLHWPANREEVEFGILTITKKENELEPELRKIIFDPRPGVDGIAASNDPLFEVRAAVYLMSGRRRRAASK
jgi:catalase